MPKQQTKGGASLEECAAGVFRNLSKGAYAVLACGLWMLKARAILSQKAGTAEKRLKFRHSAGSGALSTLSEDEADDGFQGWLVGQIVDTPLGNISRATAYNFMRAAENMGLTHESSEADVEKMEQENALAGKRLSQLYRKALPEGHQPQMHLPDAKPEQLFFNFEAAIDEMIAPESPQMKSLHFLDVEKLTNLERKLTTAREAVKEALAIKKQGRARA